MTANRVAPGAELATGRDSGAMSGASAPGRSEATSASTADSEALADAAVVALIAFRAAREEAQAAEERARVLRDDAVLELHSAGWTVRRIAAELDLSPARIGQLTMRARERRATEWGATTMSDRARTALQGDRLDSFHAARHAQVLREEAYSGGGVEERAAFYGRLDAPAVVEAESALTWKAWLEDAAVQA